MSSDPILAYRSEAFLDSDDGRLLRILAEDLQPLQAFQRERVHDTIVFFGSARLREDGPLGRYYVEARELARLVTEWSLSLPCDAHRFIVCSGGGGGIMEAANRGAADAGGRTIGLNIGPPHEERPNPYPWRRDAPRAYWDPQHFKDIWRNCQDDGMSQMLCHLCRARHK